MSLSNGSYSYYLQTFNYSIVNNFNRNLFSVSKFKWKRNRTSENFDLFKAAICGGFGRSAWGCCVHVNWHATAI
jgi:hypothetical protein